jgi:hypothetical protein
MAAFAADKARIEKEVVASSARETNSPRTAIPQGSGLSDPG